MDNFDFRPSTTTNAFFNTNSAQPKGKLWNDSENTIKFVAPFLSFSKERRFKWSSIYWPENEEHHYQTAKKGRSEVHEAARRISKLIDEEEKNEDRMRQIKRTLSIGKSQINSVRKQSHVVLSTKKPFKLSKDTERIVNKLAPVSVRRQSLLRDRHGNRCNMFHNPQEVRDTPSFFSDSTGFKTSRKVQLELPHNYYPGPGAYEIKRYLSELEGKAHCLPLKGTADTDK